MSSPNPKAVTVYRGDSGVLCVSGDLTFATANSVLQQSQSLLAEFSNGLVMDLAEVGRVDSAGLALLTQWMRATRELGADIHFRHVPEQLLAIARASDMEHILPLEGK